ncbi:MAG: division/cell wall cluster transcriptional repressor MraZ [Bacteroidota bacterium]
MKALIGEYGCNIDSKGRFLMPAGLRKQLPEDQQTEFVVNKGLGKCLVLYPLSVWEKELAKIQSRNQYIKKNRDFTRWFMQGASPLNLDGNGRLLLPKRLMAHAGLTKEIVLASQIDKIEIWDKAAYETWMDETDTDFEQLAEEVMGEA